MSRIDSIAKNFEPSAREKEIYQDWLEHDCFKADAHSPKKPFTIVMPPPNITGKLHIGHALDLSLQDVLIRYKRMKGFEALYLPGTDHASIATEAKIVEALRKEGIDKEDLGREGFLKRAWAWREEYGNNISEQSKRLGLSADWSRTRFTLDEGLSKAVRKVFVDFYEAGKIYRGERMVNWCPSCLTSISDAEVEHEDTDGFFWHINYPLADGSGFLEIATTRPETMLGDMALAVHPDDERYKELVGKEVILPLVGRRIPVIADDYVKMDFGTGIVKITPAHDPNDFEVGRGHNLEILNIMNEDGSINEAGGKYAGLPGKEARKRIVEDLKAEGLLVSTEKIVHQVGHCYRCHSEVEPRVSLQWFVAMKEMAEPAIEAVRDKTIDFVPERFSKLYFNWMENIRDWCISRQLWWGHRIPAWYCDDCAEITVSMEEPEVCAHCGSKHIHQDPDTLDTWFSSALWPFSTLGWPEETADVKKFYPTDVLVTGYDIITFWVSRMIFSALVHTGQAPFKDVLIHGLVRDEQGRKMSKSLGNGIDPIEVINAYGADALRYALLTGISQGNDVRMSTQKIESGRNFINKVWNAFRFALMNFDDEMDFASLKTEELETSDRWILSKLQKLIEEVNSNFEQYEVGLALAKIYSFLWDDFCDWYIEMVKPRLRTEGRSRLSAQFVLNTVLCDTVKLLHPFMPFVTEEIWKSLIHEPGRLILAPWPEVHKGWRFENEAADIEDLMEVLRAVRNIRAEMNVALNQKIHLILVSPQENVRSLFEHNPKLLLELAGVATCETRESDADIPDTAVSAVFRNGSLHIPLEDLIDLEKERERLANEALRLEGEVLKTQKKLENKAFTEKAPPAVVQREREKLANYETMLQSTRQRLKQLEA